MFFLQRAHPCAQSDRGEELDFQKDTGFVRGVSDETTDDGLAPLEDLEDSEVQSKVLPLTPVRCGENARTPVCIYVTITMLLILL